jgi:hypothetical protein
MPPTKAPRPDGANRATIEAEEWSRRTEVIQGATGVWQREMNLPEGYQIPALTLAEINRLGLTPVAAAFVTREPPAQRSRWAILKNLEVGLADPSGRVEFLRALGTLLRPYSGEAADYLESYEEDR